MADRNFNRAQNLEKEVKGIFADINIGAAGAPTIVKALGIASVVRNSAGDYTITLNDKYVRFMSFQVSQVVSSPQDLKFQIKAQDVVSAKTVEFVCLAVATPTDPSNGSKLLIQLELKNSSAGE